MFTDEDMFTGCECLGEHYCGDGLSPPVKAQVQGIWFSEDERGANENL